MWRVAVTYDDPDNFLSDKALFTASLQSVVTYLNKFVLGDTTLNLTVQVSKTSTGRFAGGATPVTDHVEGGITWVTNAMAKELAAGANLNGNAADLTIFVDPTTSYFKSLSFDAAPYDGARKVPAGQTDGLSVLLHEIVHAMGVTSYRGNDSEFAAGSPFRTIWDGYIKLAAGKLLLDMPDFAAHGIDPVQVTSTSATQNNSHLGDATNLQNGSVDDLMNGLAFYLGHRYEIGELDLLILQGLGFTVVLPEGLKLSDASLGGKGLAPPIVAQGSALPATSSNLVHLSGTALAGSTTSILEHGVVIAQTRADAGGHWSLDAVIDPLLANTRLVVRDGTHLLDSAPLAASIDARAGLHLFASERYKTLAGSAHDDLFTAGPSGPSGASFDGGAGLDTVEYKAAHGAATIARQPDGGVSVGADTLRGVERIRFADAVVAFDTGLDGHAGQAYRVYQAAFNRTPDGAGLGFWIGMMDRGMSLLDVARGFVGTAEFKDLYGANPDSAGIVGRYYENVLHRAPDQGGFAFWVDYLEHKGGTAADVLANFSQSEENVAALVGVMREGVGFIPA